MTAPPGMKASGRDLVSGILTTSVMVAVVIFLGRFSMPLKIFLPLSLIYYRAAYGRSGGTLILAGSILCIFLAGRDYVSGDEIIYCSCLLFLGFLIQECLEKGLSLERTVTFSLVGFVTVWLTVLIVAYGGWQHYLELGIQEVGALLAHVQESGIMEESGLGQFAEQQPIDVKMLVLTALGMRLTGIMFVAWLNLRLARFLYFRFGWTYPRFNPPSLWKAPDNLVWAAIACLGGYIFFQGEIQDLSQVLGMVVAALYLMNGAAIAGFYMNKFRIPGPQQILILGLAILAAMPVAIPVLTGLGLFDLWADFRKLQNKGFTEDDNEGDIN